MRRVAARWGGGAEISEVVRTCTTDHARQSVRLLAREESEEICARTTGTLAGLFGQKVAGL